MIGIFLENQDHFHSNIPILGGFHTAIRLEYYMGKYIQESWLEESLKKTCVFGVKVVAFCGICGIRQRLPISFLI